MTCINDPSKWSQDLEQLISEYRQIQSDLSRCRCSRCNNFGVASGWHDYYGIIYKCNCQAVFWVINPETGDRIEEVET